MVGESSTPRLKAGSHRLQGRSRARRNKGLYPPEGGVRVIPHLVAGEIRETLLEYLRSTWQLADRDMERPLLAFLAGERGMFTGPWVRPGLCAPQPPCYSETPGGSGGGRLFEDCLRPRDERNPHD